MFQVSYKWIQEKDVFTTFEQANYFRVTSVSSVKNSDSLRYFFSILSADLIVYHVFLKFLIANLCGCLVFLSTLSTDSNVHGIFSLPPVQSSGHSGILQCLSEFSHVFQDRSILVKRYISYIKKFREFWHNQTDFRIKVKSSILPFSSI